MLVILCWFLIICGVAACCSFLQPIVKVFHALLMAGVRSTFHKVNVHAGEQCHFLFVHCIIQIWYVDYPVLCSTDHSNSKLLTAMKPADLSKQLEIAFEQAHQLLTANKGASTSFLQVPNVTVSILSVVS